MSGPNSDHVQTWVDLLKHFDQARSHFAEAYRQTLLGSAETIRVLQQLAGEDEALQGESGPVMGVLDLLRRALMMWADRIPGLLEASDLDLAKREALVTVQEVLLAEVQRTSEAPETEHNRVKLDALQAILKVVEVELAARPEATDEAAEPANGSMRRVVIE